MKKMCELQNTTGSRRSHRPNLSFQYRCSHIRSCTHYGGCL